MTIRAEEGEMLEIEVEKSLLEANRMIAAANRKTMERFGVRAIDVMGSVGSGKTSLIEEIVKRLKGRLRMAVIAGDVTTTIDADRIGRHGVPTVQVNTGRECHLDALLVKRALSRLNLDALDVIFIENVGNLICPADFPLGASRRVVVVSVTEGPYMVRKHPMIFMGADVIAINKIDLAEAMGVDPKRLANDARRINPAIKAVYTNGRTGDGVKELIEALGL